MSSKSRKRKAEDSIDANERGNRRIRAASLETSDKLESQSGLDSDLSSQSAHTADALLSLLDFTSLTTHEEISARFDAIAKEILRHFLLRVACPRAGGAIDYTDYEVLELEFYLHMPGVHEDPFTHGSDEQRQSGRWYFHRAPRRTASGSPAPSTSSNRAPSAAGGYRGGTRKGLDLTLGSPPPQTDPGRTFKFFPSLPSPPENQRSKPRQAEAEPPRGGALLRTLRRVSDNKVISGPSLLVDEVLRASKASAIAELVTAKWHGDTRALSVPSASRAATCMYFSPKISPRASPQGRTELRQSRCAPTPTPKIYTSPRIGIDLSHASVPLPSSPASRAHPRVLFVAKPYRYFVHPHLLTSNGRGHTFLGVFQASIQQAAELTAGGDTDADNLYRADTDVLARVGKTTGLKADTVSRYAQEYRAALESGTLAAFVGSRGKGAGSSPVPFLRMLGALDRLRRPH